MFQLSSGRIEKEKIPVSLTAKNVVDLIKQYRAAEGISGTSGGNVLGTGTPGYIPIWESGTTLSNSRIIDDGTNVSIDTGYIGIGTASPVRKIEMYDSDNNTTLFSNASNGIRLNNPLDDVFNHESEILFAVKGNNFAGIAGIYNTFTDQAGGALVFGTRSGNSADGTGINERMRIAANGIITVGTPNFTISGPSNASAVLTVGSGSGSATDKVFRVLGDLSPSEVERFTVLRNGNVGIGVVAPSYMLDVNGDVNIVAGSHYKIGGTNLSYGDIGAEAAGAAATAVSGTASYYALFSAAHAIGDGYVRDVGGLVGIGTVSDAAKILWPLTVRKSAAEASICITGPDGYQQALWLFNETSIRWGIYRPASTTDLRIGVASDTDKMTFKSDGKVGIGTASPARKIEMYDSDANTTLFSNTMNGIRLNNPLSDVFNHESEILFGMQSANFAGIAGIYNTYTDQVGGALVFGTRSGNSADGTGITERMRIAANGIITVGTPNFTISGASSSSAVLTVGSGSGSATDKVIRVLGDLSPSEVERFTILRNGKVGIGITSPSTILTIQGDGTEAGGELLLINGVGGCQVALCPATAVNAFVGTKTNNHFYVRTNNLDRIMITDAGNVGIGIVPLYIFHVAGPEMRLTSNAAYGIIRASNTDSDYYSALSALNDSDQQINITMFGSTAVGTTCGINNAKLGTLACDGDALVVNIVNAYPIYLGTNDVARMTILGDGKIGIGTMIPGYEFEVVGDVKISAKFGCNGADPQAAYAIGNACTDLATVISLANLMRTLLLNNGTGKVS